MEDSLQLTNSRNFKFYMTYIKKRFFFFSTDLFYFSVFYSFLQILKYLSIKPKNNLLWIRITWPAKCLDTPHGIISIIIKRCHQLLSSSILHSSWPVFLKYLFKEYCLNMWIISQKNLEPTFGNSSSIILFFSFVSFFSFILPVSDQVSSDVATCMCAGNKWF